MTLYNLRGASGLWLAGNEGMEKKMETIGLRDYRDYIGFRGLGFRAWKEWKRHGNYYNGLHRDYDKDPFLHS